MTTTPPHVQRPPPSAAAAPAPAPPTSDPHRLDSPLRLRWLGKRLAGQPGAEEALRQALGIHVRMGQIAEHVSRADVDIAERGAAVRELVRLRVEFDAVVGRTLSDAPDMTAGDLGELRERLAELLGVPLAPEFYPLLELKAAEYAEQGRAFDQVAADFGFVEGDTLGAQEARGALVLTHNGSLLQISAPGVGGDPTARRFVYQNIYGGKMPSEGTLRLAQRVNVGHRVRTNHMETSPVRKLRLAVRPEGWDRQRETFKSLSLALAPKAGAASPMRTIWGAHPAWHPAVLARSVQMQRAELSRARVEQASLSARSELREHLLRLADPAMPAGDPVLDADVLGLCMYLQRLRAEAGEAGHRLADLAAFVTDRAERCSLTRRGEAIVVTLERPSRAPVTLCDVGLIEQFVIRGAPVALVDRAGAIAAVLGDVVWIEPRSSS